MELNKILAKLGFKDYKRCKWAFAIIATSLLVILIVFVFNKNFFETINTPFSYFLRFLWVLPFSFMGFSFFALRVAWRMELEDPWFSYIFIYSPKIIALSLIIFSLLSLFESSSGYIYYFLSAGLGLYVGQYLDLFKLEDVASSALRK